jgi:hypothetical protein
MTSLSDLAAQIDCLDALVVTAGLSPAMADAQTIFDIDLAEMARVLRAFDGRVRDGSVAVCIASMAGHIGACPSETLAALDDPLTSPSANLTNDPAIAYILAKLGVIRLVRRGGFSLGGARCPNPVSFPGPRGYSDGNVGAVRDSRSSGDRREECVGTGRSI